MYVDTGCLYTSLTEVEGKMTYSRQSILGKKKKKYCKPGLCTSYSSVFLLSAAKERVPQPPTVLTSHCSLHILRVPLSSPCLPSSTHICPSNTHSGLAPLTFCAGVWQEDGWGVDLCNEDIM